MKQKLYVLFTILIVVSACGNRKNETRNPEQKAKYVFYFIGDGMGLAQACMAEAYLAAENGKIGNTPLTFTSFPNVALAHTYSANSYITCSSAAGTALSTGYKTNNGMLGMLPDSTALKSISYKIHEAGFKVGIITNVTINHATPGAFYACAANRKNYYEIALQLPESGFEFFGGGGIREPEGKDGNMKSAYEIATEKGYSLSYGKKGFDSIKNEASKIIMLQEKDIRNNTLPYSIERKENDLRLSQVIESAIEFLDNGKGFFIMAEGGQIDGAGHSNDVKSNILEVLDLDDAVKIALAFYNRHPEETLIVVTADHETGGLALGNGGYELKLNELHKQDGLKNDINGNEVDKITKNARVGWTTGAHTGIAVPVYSIGVGSELFGGRLDNTDIPKRICTAMGVEY